MSATGSPKFQNKAWLWAIPLVWVALIALTSSSVITIPQLAAFVSNISGGRVTTEEFTQFWIQIWWLIVKGWHCTQFGLLFLFFRLLFRGDILKPAMIAGILAVLDELHQTSVPGRGGRFSDMCIDWLGIGVAVLLIHWKTNPAQSDGEKVIRLALVPLGLMLLYWLSVNPSPMIRFG